MDSPSVPSNTPSAIRQNKIRRCLLVLAFISIFVLSSLTYYLDKNHQSYILLFPSANSIYQNQNFQKLYAERRKVPVPKVLPPGWNSRERKIYYMLKELFYGPGSGMIRAYPFIPNGSKINSLTLAEDDLFIDFSKSLIIEQSEHYFQEEALIALIKKVLYLNFPKLKNIYFTIEGTDLPVQDANTPNHKKS